jgi:hypothetical protein
VSGVKGRAGSFCTSLVENIRSAPIFRPLAHSVDYPSGRVVGCWDRALESRSGHGCLSLVFICCVVLCR